MSHLPKAPHERAVYSEEGFADHYDRYRLRPPPALLDLLARLAQAPRPRLVVDLGSGTGLSARAWAERADEVVGVELNQNMLRVAEAATYARNVRLVLGSSTETGLPDACADLVTCSQSFHWMEPEPTLAEAARVLRPGGVFAAYDYDSMPAVDWELEAAVERFEELVSRVWEELDLGAGSPPRTYKRQHLARLRESGRFRYVREVVLHGEEVGDGDRYVGFVLSLGDVATVVRLGRADVAGAVEELRATAARSLPEPVPWLVGYRVRLGVR